MAELTESDPEMDLDLSANLVHALTWTTAEKRREASAFGDPQLLEETLQAATMLDYLVVHRLADEAVVATYVVEASIPYTVRYEYREGDDRAECVAAFAKSALWSDARSKIQAKLATATGGTVTIDRFRLPPGLGPAPLDPAGPQNTGNICLLYTSPSPRDQRGSRMPSSA